MPKTEVALRDTPNRILASLPDADFRLLEPHFVSVQLKVPKQLEAPNKRIDQIYFIESGFASVVANGSGRPMEVGIIGREGMTGLSVLMGFDRPRNETYIQLTGTGLRIAVAQLRHAIGQSIALHRSLLRYGYAFHIQITQTLFANGRGAVEARLARWLLLAHDRAEGDELHLTHEFLGIMLGVRRASVTDTLRTLAKDDLVALKRSTITVLDRKALQTRSKGFYVDNNISSR
jgi:CRP-like cAMP-binding protein